MDRTSLLRQSPHDRNPEVLESASTKGDQHWVPSRYNIRASADDGRLIIWNTLRGSMSVFSHEQAPQVVSMLSQKGFTAPEKELVQYLVKRGILIRKDTNEYRQFQLIYGQQQYRSDSLELILLASEDCNFRCKYCYEQFSRGTMHPLVRQGIKKMLEQRLPQLSRLNVEWFGGEPLYGFSAIEELGPWMVDMAKKHGVCYSGSMTTNGYLLTPEMADKLFAWNIRRFQITLDGPAEHHDQNRPARDGGPTFHRIFDNLRQLARRQDDFRVALRVNFDQDNHEKVPQLMDLVRQELGKDARFQFNFHAVGRWGGGNDAELKVCGTDGFEIQSRLTAEAHERGLLVSTLRTMNLPGSQVCYAARPYNIIIGATGKVMKCTVMLDTDERNIVGQLSPSGELVIDSDKLSLWTEPAFESDTQCQKCVMLPSCQGNSCPLVRMQTKQQPCVSARRHSKRLMREALKYHENCRKTHAISMMSR